MTDQPEHAEPQPNEEIRETAIVNLMTSTKIGRHPTAFFNTQLPVLQVALDVGGMTALLQPLLKPLAQPGQTPAVSYAKLLAYKQGNRGLIQYEVTGTDRGEKQIVFGKLYPDASRAERVCQTMQSLWDCFSETPQLHVPQVLGYIPDLSMLVYIPAEGEFLGDMLASDHALRYMDLAGEWLGTLHIHPLELERHLRLSSELVNAQAWAVLVGHKYPDQAESAQRIA
jgi:hypothetical protein